MALVLNHLTDEKLAHLITIAERELAEHERAGRSRAAKTRRAYIADLRAEATVRGLEVI